MPKENEIKEEGKGKVKDTNGNDIKPETILEEEVQKAPAEEEKKLEISIDDVNGLIAIIGVVMLNDDRKSVLIDHFINTMKKSNPDLVFGPAPQPQQQG